MTASPRAGVRRWSRRWATGGAVLKWLRFSSDNLLIAFAVWICTLPLLALIVVPRFGLPVAGGAALLTLVVALVVCCLVLRPKALQG